MRQASKQYARCYAEKQNTKDKARQASNTK